MNRRELLGMGAALGLSPLLPAKAAVGVPALLLMTDGSRLDGLLGNPTLTFTRPGGGTKRVVVGDLASFHSAQPATPGEAQRIRAGLTAVTGKDFKASETAAADLTEIGLPVLSPLLASYQDVEGKEPDPLYRLFSRIIPGHADGMDRKLDLIRLENGTAFRGTLAEPSLEFTGVDGKPTSLPANSIRRLAVRHGLVERTFDLQALRHCTYVGWLDTGVYVTPQTEMKIDAAGLTRLSFDEDGWASDPDGIKDPLPGKRRLQEGFRWGAVLGRITAGGDRWLVGSHLEKRALASGRLYLVINDNEHWQNNIGSYRVRLRASNAYDLGEPV